MPLAALEDVKALAVKVAILEKGLPAPPPTIRDWRLDMAGYAAFPVMSDGSTGQRWTLSQCSKRTTPTLQ